MFFNEDLSKSKIVSVMKNSTLASFVQNAYKIIILKEIDKASNASLNALLKNIEEPSSDTIFCLLQEIIIQFYQQYNHVQLLLILKPLVI
ncbi:hypothetical protein [Mycoplasmopsis agalactiae]|uniref:hypothetical protein n=1 Tax=Mycoplasmopsis agalactiae TaxID=2110 RepID=UPI001F41D8C5|nr:hypothetical protein [Mycoplasmopsis agalactiae]